MCLLTTLLGSYHKTHIICQLLVYGIQEGVTPFLTSQVLAPHLLGNVKTGSGTCKEEEGAVCAGDATGIS